MKNKLLLFSLSIVLSLYSFAQQGFSSVTEAADIAAEIVKASNRQTNFSIKEGNVANAVAVIMNNKRYVLYNPGFINSITRATGTKWAAVSVLAHEIGHHLYSRIVNGRTVSLSSELEADEFSGYILRKLGATLEESQAAMRVLASEKATHSHPARSQRLSRIAKGWLSTEDESDKYYSTITNVNASEGRTPAVQDANSPLDNEPRRITSVAKTNSGSRTSYVLATISFDTDPGVQYFLTDKYKVVKVQENRAYTVGRFARLSDRHFPYMIYDEDNNKIYIDASGRIINQRGKNIGKFTLRGK